MTTRGLILAIVSCVVVVVCGHFAAGLFARPEPIPTSYDAPRNPHFRRDWVRWTRPAESATGRAIVVISNSQGFLRERAEGELSYPAALERLLDERTGEAVDVLNWSVPGGKIPEMIVLAARAGAHAPSDIVLVTYTENFVGETMRSRLSFGISDVPLLAAVPAVRGLLSDEFLARFKVGSVAPYTSVYTGYGSLRWRTIENANEDWDWVIDDPDVDLSTLGKTVEAWDEDSSWALREFVETAQRAAPGAQVHVVAMPLARPAWTDEAWGTHGAMVERVRESVVRGGGRVFVWDALELLPPELFYTHTHFRAEGHALFAEWLAQRLASPPTAGGAAG